MYKLTQADKRVPNWPKLIREARARLQETQAEFGERFGVTYVAVSLWEAGKREAPYDVTWWLYQNEQRRAKARVERAKKK